MVQNIKSVLIGLTNEFGLDEVSPALEQSRSLAGLFDPIHQGGGRHGRAARIRRGCEPRRSGSSRSAPPKGKGADQRASGGSSTGAAQTIPAKLNQFGSSDAPAAVSGRR